MNTPPDFDSTFLRLIGHEGGYVNDPRDAGGETKFGISKRQYPTVDIAALTLDQAKAIYRRDYWQRMQGDGLPSGLAFQVFDAAVNSGIETAVRWLQQAAGVAQDGIVGTVTLNAVRGQDESVLIRKFLGVRLEFLTQLNAWQTFGRGWARRIAANLKDAA